MLLQTASTSSIISYHEPRSPLPSGGWFTVLGRRSHCAYDVEYSNSQIRYTDEVCSHTGSAQSHVDCVVFGLEYLHFVRQKLLYP